MEVVARLQHTEGRVFVAATRSGHHVTVEGAGADATAGASPMELLLVALAACSGSTLVDVLRKMRLTFDRLEIDVTGERAQQPPRVWTRIELRYRLYGPVPPDRAERAVMLAEKLCSAHAMLAPVTELSSRLELTAG